MRVAWSTDIHLNFLDAEGIAAFGAKVAALEPDVFIVSGDIAEAPSLHRCLELLSGASGLPTHFVLGNHDFYDGNVDDVRAKAAVMEESIGVWLPPSAPIRLGGECVMVGADGWGDARLGNPWGTNIRLNDFLVIRDLVSASYEELLWKLRARGDAEAETARTVIESALATDAGHIVFVTHVPPFRGACWHQGAVSNDEWLPFFTCQAVGDVLLQMAKANPERRFTVLCGHTHGRGELKVRENLHVRTGPAEYGDPQVELLNLNPN